jgi:hypothetical protein
MVGFPLLLIPLAIYNIIVFLMPTVSFTDPLVKLTLMSGAEWTVTLSDVLLTLSILLLLAEVIKGARPGAKYLTDHLLSLIVFGAAAAEFLLWPRFATSTYFLMTALALVDFLSGLALRTRRRVAVAKTVPAPAPKVTEKAEAPPPAEPVPVPAVAPAPAAPAAPPATSVAESVLAATPEPKPADQPKPKDHPEPKPATSAAAPETAIPTTPSPAVPAPEEAPPEITSPRLQPSSGFPPSPDRPDKSQS